MIRWPLALLLWLAAARAQASPPITDWTPTPRGAAADTGLERVARAAESQAIVTTNTGAGIGTILMLTSIGVESGGIFLTGLGIGAAGAVAGPAMGWARAGYSGRAAGSALLRVGIIGGTVAYSFLSVRRNDTGLEAASVVLSTLTGVALATLEAWYECGEIGTHVREHGVGPALVSLEPGRSPSGAPALALVARFR